MDWINGLDLFLLFQCKHRKEISRLHVGKDYGWRGWGVEGG